MIKNFKGVKIISLLIIILISGKSQAQKSKIGNWFIYNGNQAINKKWNWANEIQYRNYNFIGDLQQFVFKTGIGYNLTDNNNNVMLAYAFVNNQKYLTNSTKKVGSNEHRIYQQFNTKQNLGRIYLQHKYRIEERFLPNDFKLRFRYHLSVNVPINKKIMIKNTFYASLYNEIFINNQSPIFDRDRIYGGVGYVINKRLKTELGYMSQILESTSRCQFQIIFYNNLPFSKK